MISSREALCRTKVSTEKIHEKQNLMQLEIMPAAHADNSTERTHNTANHYKFRPVIITFVTLNIRLIFF